MDDLTPAEYLKFSVLADGVRVTAAAAEFLVEASERREWSPNDYASTSGLILRLEDDVWVNAPIEENNPNFVGEATGASLDVVDGQLELADAERSSKARFWPIPEYHGSVGPNGDPYHWYVITHGDRARLSPMSGCGMVCKFCNIPYEDRYSLKPIPAMVEAIEIALSDPVQPARHLLISGGTPKPADFPFLQGVYREILGRFAHLGVDIMMVPADGLLDVRELADLGVNELSINIEIVDEGIARELMRQKLQHGLDHYLRFIEDAAAILGEGRVRSMVMVGLEPVASTLRGVELIRDAGGVPVLSPFRPDPVTPLADRRPPSAAEMRAVFTAAKELLSGSGDHLGPDCPPCTHNTLQLLGRGARYPHPEPSLR